jgi:2-methylcitrate dehydratase PrpD
MTGRIIDDLVSNIINNRFEDLDSALVEAAKDRIIDVVGCIIAGANAPGCSMVVDLVREWGGKAESTILVHGGMGPAHDVAMANCVMARSADYEPVGSGHISATTIPTAIAVSEFGKVTGGDLIAALIVGDDLASRVATAANLTNASGWSGSGMSTMFGATAIAGKLLRLDHEQMRNALGIVVNQVAGTIQVAYDRVHSFKLPQGLAARAGIFSAELAAKGFTGVKDPLLSRYGFFPQYCRNYHTEMLTKNLGKEFYAEKTFKPYPCCRGNHAAIDCALETVVKHTIKPKDIQRVTVNVSPTWQEFIGQPFELAGVPQVNAIFSLRYNVANVLLRRGVKLEHFTEELIRDPQVLDLARKVEVTSTIPPDKNMAAEVAIEMKDGSRLSAAILAPRGDPNLSPMTREDIKEKYRSCVAFSRTVPQESAEEALGLLETMEETNDIGNVIRLLVGT